MRTVFIIALILISLGSGAQSSFLKEAAVKLERALLTKDTSVLKGLLHRNLSYGHSNGWIETKEDVIRDLVTKKLEYTRIETKEPVWAVEKETAILRATSDISYMLNGQPGNLHLHVVQVWIRTNKGWQLIARQSTKIN